MNLSTACVVMNVFRGILLEIPPASIGTEVIDFSIHHARVPGALLVDLHSTDRVLRHLPSSYVELTGRKAFLLKVGRSFPFEALQMLKYADAQSFIMPLRLDKVDAAILRELNRDGRLSYRKLSKLIGVSTPTVESHVRKLVDSGIIVRFVPVLNADKVESATSVIISLRAELPNVNETIEKLRQLDEVRNIFLTTGEANIVIRVVLHQGETVDQFMESFLLPLGGVRIVASEIILQTKKDEQGATFREGMAVSLNCDYCGGKIAGQPLVLNVGEGKRFLCCTSCLTLYKAKYISRTRPDMKP